MRVKVKSFLKIFYFQCKNKGVIFMQNNEMTPSEAIIVLDRLNTSERIEVDRDELRAAVDVAKKALRKLDLEINFVKQVTNSGIAL